MILRTVGDRNKIFKTSRKKKYIPFPEDFMFELTSDEYKSLRYQFGTLKRGGHSKYPPFAFTEHGVVMLATVLNSEKAIDMSISIVRAFIAIKQIAFQYKELAEQLSRLEKETKSGLKIFMKR